MLQLLTQEITHLNRTLTPDDAGGETVSFVESNELWRVRITPVDHDYSEDQSGMINREKIRLIGEIRDDISVRDRLIHDDKIWEITSVARVSGIGTIPDYLRIEASAIQEDEE